MKKTIITSLAAVLFLTLFAGLAPSKASAQTRSLDEGPVVRRQLLYRSNRIELEPGLAHSLNDPYRRTLFLNVAANYHLTNAFSLGLNVGWGFLNYDTNILDNINEANPDVAAELGFTDTTLLMNFHLAYVPFYGKFNFLDLGTVNWDFHLMGGVAAALLSADDGFDDLGGFKFGPAFGGGFRWFFSGDMAISLNIVDHMYETAVVQREALAVDEEFSHNVVFSLGVSLFVTGELRVSR